MIVGVSPAHDAPGGVLLLDAAHGLRLRCASWPGTPWPRRHPHALSETEHLRRAAAVSGPGTRLGLISQDLEERLPPGIRRRLAAHWRTDDALEPDSLVEAVGAIGRQLGSVDRLMGPLEELQVPMA